MKKTFAELMHETLDLLQKVANAFEVADDELNRKMDLAKRKMSDKIDDNKPKSKDLN